MKNFLAILLFAFTSCAGQLWSFSYTFPWTVMVTLANPITGVTTTKAVPVIKGNVVTPTLVYPASVKAPRTATVQPTAKDPKALVVPVISGGVSTPTLVVPK